MKLFRTSKIDIVNYCRAEFNFELPGTVIEQRTSQFRDKYRTRDNLYCKPAVCEMIICTLIVLSLCWTSSHPGLLRPLHFFYHRRPRRAKSRVSLRLTGTMVPPKFHLRILLNARPSFRQLPCGSRSGVGTIVQRN